VYEKARNIETLNEDGTPNSIAQMILSVLASLYFMESEDRNMRIKSGIKSRQRKGLPFGRPIGSIQDVEMILAKHGLLVKSFKTGEKMSLRKRAWLYKCSVNTVRKVERILNQK
jgi:DNA invertase Pin-like site-specific DNA recombinase